MDFFAKNAGKINKISERHEKKYAKSLLKGFVKDPFFSDKDKDVKRYNSSYFRIGNDREERAIRKQEMKERKKYIKALKKEGKNNLFLQ